MRFYIGTYSRGGSQGIYQLDLDLAAGKLSTPQLAAEAVNPSFLAIHPNRKFLYSVTEITNPDGTKGGGVNAFSIDPQTGKLMLLNQQSSKGIGSCHVTVDRAGKFLLVANYPSGNVAVLPIQPDGRLSPATGFAQHEGSGPNQARQDKPHAHSANMDPSNRFAIICDLGLDKVFVYRLNTDGTLTPNDPPSATVAPGAGPRHFTFHPNGKFTYVINEMGSTVTAFNWDGERGKLTEFQTISMLPDGVTMPDNTTAEVQVHPSGKFLYGSNRGYDSIAMFSIDPATGRLTSLGQIPSGDQTPRNFGIDPTGKWLLVGHQTTGTVRVFRIDQTSGKLEPTDSSVDIPNAVCVKFYPLTN